MLKPIATTILVALVSLAGCQSRTASPTADTSGRTGPLFEKIRTLDTAVFDAFNTCQIAGNLEKHGAFFAEDVEFYHDEGGVTWNRQDMLANTRQFVCGHYTRELMPGSLRVYPVKDFGASSRALIASANPIPATATVPPISSSSGGNAVMSGRSRAS